MAGARFTICRLELTVLSRVLGAADDAQNRLVGGSDGSASFRFNYDARNRCVSRIISGVTSYQTYDGWSLLEDRSGTGALLARYIHGGGSDEVLATVGAGGTW